MKSPVVLCAVLASSVAVGGIVAPAVVEAKTYKKICSARIEAISLKYISGNNYGAEVKKLENKYRCTIRRG